MSTAKRLSTSELRELATLAGSEQLEALLRYGRGSARELEARRQRDAAHRAYRDALSSPARVQGNKP